MKMIFRLSISLLISIIIFSGCATTKQPVGVKNSPVETPYYITLNGNRLLESGAASGAALLFQKALSMDDRYIPAITGMAKSESDIGNADEAYKWGKKAINASTSSKDRLAARQTLMEINMKFKQGKWLDEMESFWKDIKQENLKHEDSTLLMAKAYHGEGRYLDANLFYRQVIDWGGKKVAEADDNLEALFKQLRAEPGTKAGKALAPMASVTRGDLAALLIEELKLPEYIKSKTPLKYNASFKTPEAFATEKTVAALPEDLKNHPFEVDIREILNYDIRGFQLAGDGLFHPEETMDRANFALVIEDIITRIKNEPELRSAFIGNESPFPDVPNDHFAFNAMLVCTTRNFLAANLDGAFRPHDPVTGAETLLALRRLKEEIKGHQINY